MSKIKGKEALFPCVEGIWHKKDKCCICEKKRAGSLLFYGIPDNNKGRFRVICDSCIQVIQKIGKN